MAGAQAVMESENQKPQIVNRNQNQWQWKVDYARFIAHPALPSPRATLKPLANNRRFYPLGGTWISTSSPTASLMVTADESASDSILTVCCREKILEEHYVSKLHFTWPQVCCVSGFPARGGRSVIVSYKDESQAEIQKFALRFLTVHEVDSFIDKIEGNLKDKREETENQDRDLGSRISTQTEMTSSYQFPSSSVGLEKLSAVTPDDAYTPQMPSCSQYEVQSCTQERSLIQSSQGTLTALPPSFTSLVTNCISKAERVDEQPEASQDIELKSQIAKYMGDSSFKGMMAKVEQIINEIGVI